MKKKTDYNSLEDKKKSKEAWALIKRYRHFLEKCIYPRLTELYRIEPKECENIFFMMLVTYSNSWFLKNFAFSKKLYIYKALTRYLAFHEDNIQAQRFLGIRGKNKDNKEISLYCKLKQGKRPEKLISDIEGLSYTIKEPDVFSKKIIEVINRFFPGTREEKDATILYYTTDCTWGEVQEKYNFTKIQLSKIQQRSYRYFKRMVKFKKIEL